MGHKRLTAVTFAVPLWDLGCGCVEWAESIVQVGADSRATLHCLMCERSWDSGVQAVVLMCVDGDWPADAA